MRYALEIPAGIEAAAYRESCRAALESRGWYAEPSDTGELQMRAGPMKNTTLVEPAPGSYRMGPPRDPYRFRVAKAVGVRIDGSAVVYVVSRSFLARCSILLALALAALLLVTVALVTGVESVFFIMAAVSASAVVAHSVVYIHRPSGRLCRELVESVHGEALDGAGAGEEP